MNEATPQMSTDSEPLIDHDRLYKTAIIGDLVWMAENFDYGKLVDADCDDDGKAKQNYEEKWHYNNKEDGACGGLYTWNVAVDNCPKDWHLPTLKEWGILFKFVESQENPEGCLSKLGMVPAGYWRCGSFCYCGLEGIWWALPEDNQADSEKNAYACTWMWGGYL